MSDSVLIYTQASEAVGHGHAMRAIALANAANGAGLDVRFVLSDEETRNVLLAYGGSEFVGKQSQGNATYIIRDLPGENDSSEVEREVKNGATVMLLDDKGPARAEATIVCDTMMTPARAESLPQNKRTTYLYGLEYAVLRSEFSVPTEKMNKGSNRAPRVVLALGNGFESDLPRRIIESLSSQGFKGDIDVLLPNYSENMIRLMRVADKMNAKLHVQSSSVKSILCKSDLVITKLGVSMLEAFAVGVPCVLVEPTMSHLEIEEDLAKYYKDWPAIEFGLVDKDSIESLVGTVKELCKQPEQLDKMAAKARVLVDGDGAQRLICQMIEHRE